MSNQPSPAQVALEHSRRSLKAGDPLAARRWAEQAASLEPDSEEPWLLLAASADPQDSLQYLQRALQINPQSERARQGMHWAAQRMRGQPQPASPQPQVKVEPVTAEAFVRRRPAIFPWVILFGIVAALVFVWLASPLLTQAISGRQPLAIAQVNPVKATQPATPSALPPAETQEPPAAADVISAAATATVYAANAAQPSLIELFLPGVVNVPFVPTATPPPPEPAIAQQEPAPAATEQPKNAGKKKKKKKQSSSKPPEQAPAPGQVGSGERWIYVDLSQQRVYAYEGDQVVNSFLVSTGTWLHPTVTGDFRVYVKYRLADMSGPGYYLPDVPYVMYFYDGYGLHGTYWHNNFGTPMSHGCVNLRTDDAGWLFNWASVGTPVQVRK